MVYQERNTWVGMIVTVVAIAAYVVIVLRQAAGGPLTDVDWAPIMLWTIGASIVASIVISIVWGIAVGLGDPDGASRTDQRDRDISQLGDRIGQAFLVLAGLAGIVLCAVEADWFWIANTLFLGFALSALVGSVARLIVYRVGMP